MSSQNRIDNLFFIEPWAFALSLIFGATVLVGVIFYLKKSGSWSGRNLLEETGKMSASRNRTWWLSSGGMAYFDGNIILTSQGKLASGSKWQAVYVKNNPRDTDNGCYPQNIFRLVERQKKRNETQSLYFKINRLNLSASSNRNGSNGVLLFNRYQDSDNLYYAGLRVDGQVVIKKKVGGKYYTLAEAPVYSDGRKYDRAASPNFLPLQKWIGIKSQVTDTKDGVVDIKFYVDKEDAGRWQQVLDVKDNGKQSGALIAASGYAGIRADFMDAEFRGYDFSNL